MPEPQKVARLDLSTTTPAPDAVPTSFSEAPSKQTKRLHQLKPSAKIDLTTHGPVRPEPKPEPASRPKPPSSGGAPRGRRDEQGPGRSNQNRAGSPQRGGGPNRRQQDNRQQDNRPQGGRPQGNRPHDSRQQGNRQQDSRQQNAPAPSSSGSTLADLLSADVLAKLRGE